jgi:signal transduction histidine kinase
MVFAHSRRSGFVIAVACLAVMPAVPASADQSSSHTVIADYETAIRSALGDYTAAVLALSPHEMAALALALGVILFAVLSAILLVRTGARLAQTQAAKHSEVDALHAELDGAMSLLLAEPQVLVVWPAGGEEPNILGDTAMLMASPVRSRVLAFGTWLEPDKARAMENALDGLRGRGEGFLQALTTLAGGHIEAEGRAINGRAVLRLKDVSGIKRDYLVLAAAHETLGRDVEEFKVLAKLMPSREDIERVRNDMARMVEAHRGILDRLTTAVVVFAADQRLSFCNAAYRTLWELDAAFLDQAPTDATVLDRLRDARKLPEEVDFRKWMATLHEAYRATQPREHQWHLPNGHTLRVVAAPNPEGGVTYLFDDLTERIDLARRNIALEKVRNETLDNLAEAVAVFASDGRLSLSNKAFARMWKLSPAMLSERPHIEAVIDWCRPLHHDEQAWQSLRGAVTGLEHREMSGRLPRVDGTVLDCTTLPLPDGATLVTFQDVTDSVNVEQALRERAEALEMADKLKSEFVHHVSYELRSPLTNIIGFAQLLEDKTTGPLSDKQREYLGYIGVSSSALLAIINDILDLATIDAGAMRLALGNVDIRHAMQAAAEGVQDRLVEKSIALEIVAAGNVGSFMADERRVRQILYNLLSNAIGFSPPAGTIRLEAERRADGVVFAVTDRGPGIPPKILDRVFERFETHTLGSEHRGAGLGLSIVRSFVELHGGKVMIESTEGEGTTVVCIFPLEHTAAQTAAE